MNSAIGIVSSGVCIEPRRQTIGCIRGTRVAPAEDLRQRAFAVVERDQAVPEAGHSGGVVLLSGNGLVDRLADELDDACRIALSRIVTAGRFALSRLRVEDLRADGGGTDIDREDPRHARTITARGGSGRR